MKILFLDIDGVLNSHGFLSNRYCGIEQEKVNLLNRVIDDTGCGIVITSAWRYMILGGDMTLKGFEYMLLTHGIKCGRRLIGYTPSDEDVITRGKQISAWIENELPKVLEKNGSILYKYIVIDDLDKEKGIQISEAGHPLIQTNGKIGLTNIDCDKIIRILNGN